MSYFKEVSVKDASSGVTAEVNASGEVLVNSETLNLLIQTLQELISRLAPLASMANSGAPALRTIPIASVSTAVTGSVTASIAANQDIRTVATVTTAGTLTNLGTGKPASEVSDSINRMTVTLGNINNVSIT